jgi:hypothetical protein
MLIHISTCYQPGESKDNQCIGLGENLQEIMCFFEPTNYRGVVQNFPPILEELA